MSEKRQSRIHLPGAYAACVNKQAASTDRLSEHEVKPNAINPADTTARRDLRPLPDGIAGRCILYRSRKTWCSPLTENAAHRKWVHQFVFSRWALSFC